jgi:hypothetical protein
MEPTALVGLKQQLETMAISPPRQGSRYRAEYVRAGLRQRLSPGRHPLQKSVCRLSLAGFGPKQGLTRKRW